MSQVTIYINAKPYHLACDTGQEGHVTEIARYFDGKVRDLTRQIGQAPDNMLFLMTAMTMIDQMAEYEREIELLRRQVDQFTKEANLRKVSKKAADASTRDLLDQVATKLESTAEQLEALV
jgi:cell division protein ZapA